MPNLSMMYNARIHWDYSLPHLFLLAICLLRVAFYRFVTDAAVVATTVVEAAERLNEFLDEKNRLFYAPVKIRNIIKRIRGK